MENLVDLEELDPFYPEGLVNRVGVAAYEPYAHLRGRSNGEIHDMVLVAVVCQLLTCDGSVDIFDIWQFCSGRHCKVGGL